MCVLKVKSLPSVVQKTQTQRYTDRQTGLKLLFTVDGNKHYGDDGAQDDVMENGTGLYFSIASFCRVSCEADCVCWPTRDRP